MHLLVHNKCDLLEAIPSPGTEDELFISARTGQGIEQLIERLGKIIEESTAELELALVNERQRDSLLRVEAALLSAQRALAEGLPGNVSHSICGPLRRNSAHSSASNGRTICSTGFSRSSASGSDLPTSGENTGEWALEMFLCSSGARGSNVEEKLHKFIPDPFGAVAFFYQSAGILPQLAHE